MGKTSIEVTGASDPVVKIIEESTGKWVYALRIRGQKFRPKVFAIGSYTVEVGEGDKKRVLTGVKASSLDERGTLKVAL